MCQLNNGNLHSYTAGVTMTLFSVRSTLARLGLLSCHGPSPCWLVRVCPSVGAQRVG